MASRKASPRASTRSDKQLLTATEAASFLGIKPATLYTYVSRHEVESLRGTDGRSRLYALRDLLRLKQRREARAGHTAVAAAALSWGDPIMDSAITSIGPEGPRYRGRPAVALAEAGVSFEAVADSLWTGEPPAPIEGPANAESRPTSSVSWPGDDRSGRGRAFARAAAAALTQLSETAPPRKIGLCVVRLGLALLESARAPVVFERGAEDTWAEARRVLPLLAAMPAVRDGPRRRAALAARGIARRLALAWARPEGAVEIDACARAIDQALVLCADHELATATFAARAAASAGGELYATLATGLAAVAMVDVKVFGPIHAMATSITSPSHAARALDEILARRSAIPGFGQPPYPDGDPRATPLLRAARTLAPGNRRVQSLTAVVDAAAGAGRGGPTLEVGLVALACALALPCVAPAVLFALGRSAGWIAHAMEQCASGQVIRPRARYVGAGA